MPKPSQRNELSLRQQIADEAARLMLDQGIRDFGLAKRKASERFGQPDRGALPRNTEIEAALSERSQLFDGAEHQKRLQAARERALKIMRWFYAHSPRAVGGVVSGALSPHDAIEIHLFTDAPEDIAWALHDRGVPYRDRVRRFRRYDKSTDSVPLFSFAEDGVLIELLAFPEDGVRQAPLSAIDGKPMRRVSAKKLSQLSARANA